ncbi:hypothetical protein LPJ60_001907 [Coemansia sp. RSA 2675]|nr:hypothetical protein LPJ60_001907 [Coemansia sp. RSA 2675]KAJ2693504.1 hypothetical protein H4218_006009 [Coemansia sp. IMI 209128]
MAKIDMGELLPKEPVSRRITGDTQFMFQFYKPCIHYYPPPSSSMSTEKLRLSLVTALQGCPLLFGRFKIHPDLTISLDYDPLNPNPPTLEFARASVTYSQLRSQSFSYAVAKQRGLDMAIPDGTITRGFDLPMLMVKVTYLGDGGVALFSMTNHVAFDGNAMFSFIAHWARCNRLLGSVDVPADLESYATSMVTCGNKPLVGGPVEISVDATRTPKEIAVGNSKAVGSAEGVHACVFALPVAHIKKLKTVVEESGVLGEGEWVSSNNVVAAFIAQCVARANMEAQVYESGEWTVFQALDMRRPLGLPARGLGSPLILAECRASASEIMDSNQFSLLARRVRGSVDKYRGEYLQGAMDWMNESYGLLAKEGVLEPWRHFWFTALNTNERAVGVSCMNRIPVYDADFGAGRPTMARSFNPRPNYIIVFPGPPVGGSLEYEALHLYVTLERPAMEALRADKQWSGMCSLVSE